MTQITRSSRPFWAVALAAVLLVGGCAQEETDYSQEVSERLQAEVLEVSQLSAEADYAAAMNALTELEVALKDARARGDITDERFESIMAALAQVRVDLQAAIDAQAPPPEPVSPPQEDGGGNGDNGGGNEGDDEGNQGKGDDKGNKDKKGGGKDD